MHKTKDFIKIVGKLVSILSLIFIILAAVKLEIDFSLVKNPGTLGLLFIFASLMICVSEYILAYSWKLLLDFFSRKKCKYIVTAKVYAKANIGKYLPGNVMHYVERNLFAKDLGLQHHEILLSTFIEIIGLAGVSVLLSFLLSFSSLKKSLFELIDPHMLLLIGCVVILLFLIIVFGGILKFKSGIQDFLSKYTLKKFVTVLLSISVPYVVFLLISAFILLVTLGFLGVVNTTDASKIVSSYIIAWLLGFIIPGAPGGIGVREFVLLLLLGDLYSSEMLLTSILIHRIITIAGDFLAYLISIVLKDKDIEIAK